MGGLTKRVLELPAKVKPFENGVADWHVPVKQDKVNRELVWQMKRQLPVLRQDDRVSNYMAQRLDIDLDPLTKKGRPGFYTESPQTQP